MIVYSQPMELAMELQSILLCALVLSLASCLQLDGGQNKASEYPHVTVCPEDYSPRDGCVTLDKLKSRKLIKSNTSFKFKPATFKMKADSVIIFENVSNITLESAGTYKVDIACVGNNSGFIFIDVSGLVVQNMMFTSCIADTGLCRFKSSLCVDQSSNIILKNLTLRDGLSGLAASNVYGNFIVDSLFVHNMEGSALILYSTERSELCSQCYSAGEQWTVVISNSQFVDSRCFPCNGFAFAINIQIGELLTTGIHLENVTMTNNTHGSSVPGIVITSDSAVLHTVFKGVNYAYNHVVEEHFQKGYSTGVSDLFILPISTGRRSHIEIIDSIFANNDFRDNSQAVKSFDIDWTPYSVLYFGAYNVMISISNTTISNNTGWYEAALLVNANNSYILLDSSVIANNSFYVSDYYKKGTVQLNSINNVTVHNCSFVKNSATGLLVQGSNIYFSGDNIIRGNKGYNGGGMALNSGSTLTLSANATISFEDNIVENNGGGLYVKEGSCVDTSYTHDELECFITVHKHKTTLLHFNNNSAKTAGNDWYGGNLYCVMNVLGHGWQVITDITDWPANYTLDLTSDPLHVCDCSTESNHDSIKFVHTIQKISTYPGRSFNLSLLAVGQLLNISTLSGVPSAIYAGLLPLHNKSGSIPDIMTVQNGKRRCSNLTYCVSSFNAREIMVLTVEDNIDKIPEYFLSLWQQNDSQWHRHIKKLLLHHLSVPAYVAIHLLPCPVGFELSQDADCVCTSQLIDYVTSCSIDTMLITRKSPIWLSFIKSSQEHYEHDNVSFVYLIHQQCPFDYCLSGDFNFSLEDPDTQCNHNRSGILCGECKPGYSLTLGTNECKQCTNIYLLLLVPFALAGVLLIAFLSLTDMTVTAGTINGLLFFANLVRENQATFFPAQTAETFLSVFIAWLNLDLGISSCFFDGLDAYALTFLQLSFPIYIWLLAFGIIIASRHFAFMNKLCGQNIVQVLATLFFFSPTLRFSAP